MPPACHHCCYIRTASQQNTAVVSATLCRGITRQVLATVRLRTRLNGHPVGVELPVPTDDVTPSQAGLTSSPFTPDQPP